MATHGESDATSRTGARLLPIVMVVMVVTGVGLMLLGDQLQASIGIVLFILSVVAFLVVVKQTFDDHPDW